jgi:ADP-dependent phosphofructokinase/glucokinase
LDDGKTIINSNEDAIRGIIKCFKSGIAEEWLIENVDVFNWLNRIIGYDKLQMGGQGGIVANAMAVCGVNPVYVHTASSPKNQAKLFLDLPNLLNVNHEGELEKAYTIDRVQDTPLIHWIIEFDKADKIKLNNVEIICPKSNRFIATYDPLNFKLHIDEAFDKKMSSPDTHFEYIILSGYQMLQSKIAGNETGIERIDKSKKIVERWKETCPDHILHFEIASTQDTAVRKYLIDTIAKDAHSIGFNERELIDILEVIDEKQLAIDCDKNTHSSNLFKGMLKVFDYVNCPRIQLHMFGLYITLQKKGFKITPEQNKKGMQLAANIAATKAGTGSISTHEVLLWSKNQHVADVGLNELQELSETVEQLFGANNLLEAGIYSTNTIDIIAVPTIIIDKPITLVGMGDTISSISLVGAR